VGYSSVAENTVYLHSFSRCCLPNLRNHAKFWTYKSSRSSKVTDLGGNRKRILSLIATLDYLLPLSRYWRISFPAWLVQYFAYKPFRRLTSDLLKYAWVGGRFFSL